MGIRQRQSVSGRLGLPLASSALVALWGTLASAQARDVEGAKRWQLGEPAPVGYHVARKHTLLAGQF